MDFHSGAFGDPERRFVTPQDQITTFDDLHTLHYFWFGFDIRYNIVGRATGIATSSP